jgi:hypothetical protein
MLAALSAFFEDLCRTMFFLQLPKEKIAGAYGDSIDAEEYYMHHYDNFLIRIATSIVICGKLGNQLYRLEIPERHANWYSFSIHSKMKNSEVAGKLW